MNKRDFVFLCVGFLQVPHVLAGIIILDAGEWFPWFILNAIISAILNTKLISLGIKL